MNPFKPRPYNRMVECVHCGRVTVCILLSEAFGRSVWRCDEGHTFDDRV